MKSGLPFLLAAFVLGAPSARADTQCVSNAVAGGTVDALTIPLQPCAASTNLLILTLAGANTVAQPTLKQGGYPAQNIYTSTGTAPGIGALPGAGAVVMLTSTGTSWKIVSGNASTVFSGVLTVPNGGTGDSTLAVNALLVGEGTGAVSTVAAGATGTFLGGNTGSPPSFKTISSNLVSSITFNSIGLTPSSATTGAVSVAGTLVAGNGGTGQSSYAVGDLLYASGATALSKLPDVATGNSLISGGVTTAPSWGKIGLTTHVSGTLPVANGGSGAASFTANGVLYGNTTSAFGATAAGTTGQYFCGSTGNPPAWCTLSSGAVTTIGFGTTGLTPSAATGGAVTVAGTLVVANGGTGATSLTSGGLLVGNGASAVSAISPGTNGQLLVGVTGAAPVWTSTPAAGTTSISFGSTGLTPSSATGGVVTVAGTLAVASGGSGAVTLTGALKGNGTSAFSQAACADLSNGATGCSTAVGTSGATLPLLSGANTWSGVQTFLTGDFKLGGAGAGLLTQTYANSASSGTLTWPAGTTDFSATGGTSQVVKQTGAGAALTVGQLGISDLTNVATNTVLGNATSGTAAVTALAVGTCSTAASALKWTTNAGFGCNTAIDATTLLTATWASPSAIGTGTPAAGTFTTLSDSVGNVRSIVHSGADKTTSYTLATTDNGQYVSLGASGAIVVPNSTFADGNVVSVFNNTASGATITINATTCYIAGTNTNKGGGGTVTLATRGTVTILFLGTTSCVMNGNVS